MKKAIAIALMVISPSLLAEEVSFVDSIKTTYVNWKDTNEAILQLEAERESLNSIMTTKKIQYQLDTERLAYQEMEINRLELKIAGIERKLQEL